MHQVEHKHEFVYDQEKDDHLCACGAAADDCMFPPATLQPPTEPVAYQEITDERRNTLDVERAENWLKRIGCKLPFARRELAELLHDYSLSCLPTPAMKDAAEIEQQLTAYELVQQQAEDEGLWFQHEYITEDYLQRALRALHEAVERDHKSLWGKRN